MALLFDVPMKALIGSVSSSAAGEASASALPGGGDCASAGGGPMALLFDTIPATTGGSDWPAAGAGACVAGGPNIDDFATAHGKAFWPASADCPAMGPLGGGVFVVLGAVTAVGEAAGAAAAPTAEAAAGAAAGAAAATEAAQAGPGPAGAAPAGAAEVFAAGAVAAVAVETAAFAAVGVATCVTATGAAAGVLAGAGAGCTAGAATAAPLTFAVANRSTRTEKTVRRPSLASWSGAFLIFKGIMSWNSSGTETSPSFLSCTVAVASDAFMPVPLVDLSQSTIC
mmetsp:Transcript_38002/g.95453  ORF Transcript_38002/g.95453 Transcript_38002/m.95453 type:complete len:284 (-) Transcript_38002:260-1111(-)